MKIAVLLGGLRFDSQRRIINGILENAVEDDANVYIFTCDVWTYSSADYNAGEHSIFELPDFSEYDGVILHGDTVYDSDVMDAVVAKIKKSGVPCISLNIEYPGIYCLGMENEQGVYEITDHFIKEHHAKRLGFISGPESNKDAAGRLNGFRKALLENHVRYDESYVFYGDYHPDSGKEAIEYFYDMPGRFPDAIVAANDEMALGAFYALQELGYDVPGQVLLSGYDNAYVARHHYPRITSVKRPELELGKEAYNKLKAVINGEKIKKKTLLESTVVYAQSCGCECDEEEPKEEFRRTVVKDKLHVTNYSEIVRSSSADFTGVETFEQLLSQIRRYLMLTDAKEFYMCLCELEQPDIEALAVGKKRIDEDSVMGYQSEVYIPIALNNGVFKEYGKYDIKQILPSQVTDGKKGQFYTIVPLHYQSRSFGYCVLGNSRLMMDSDLFHLFIMNINNALENVRKQNMLNSMVQKLNKMWIYDSLTGVFNRAGFFRFAYEMVTEAKEKRQNLFVLFLDLDGLKSINDRFGHDVGDEFIKAMSKILMQVHKHGQLLMRYGGDEFVVMTINFTKQDAEAYIGQIKGYIDTYNEVEKKVYKLDASMGYTIMNPREESFDLEELIESADREMYKVKNLKKQHKAETENQNSGE